MSNGIFDWPSGGALVGVSGLESTGSVGLNQRVQVTPLHDTPYLSTNEERIRTHVLFLRENEINRENAVLLTGGAVVDVCTMSFNERMRMASTVIEEAGDIPSAVGTNHQHPRIRTAIQATALAASSSQVSCPVRIYFCE